MLRPFATALAAACFAFSAVAAGAEDLSQPPGIDPQVRFWTRTYAEVDSQGGLIHDDENLAVVYEIIRFGPNLSSRGRQRHADRVKEKYRRVLRSLARGKRTGLSRDEARVLALWPQGVSNTKLRRATSHVRYQMGQADKFREGLIRSGAWIDYIERVMIENDVPRELRALPHVESSFTPTAYSRVGAAGLWQFTRGTGRIYLRVDHVVDERLDPHKATVAAARLLRDNFRRVKTWPLAITSYNHGAGGMERAVRQLGTRNIDTIIRRYKGRTFGFASRNFYTSFLAAVHVDSNAEQYFGPLHRVPPTNYETIVLDHFYSVASLSRALGISSSVLKADNPALRPAIFGGSKLVPRGYALNVSRERLSRPASLAMSSIPAKEQITEQKVDRFYKVRRGDTLSRIAQRFHVRERDLVAVNNLRSRNLIRAGQVLRLPEYGGGPASMNVARESRPSDGVYTVRRGDTLSRIAERFGVSQTSLVSANRLRSRNRIAAGQRLRIPGGGGSSASIASASSSRSDATHVVRRGDAVSTLARRYGVSESSIVRANGLRSKNRIAVGQRLRIPGGGSRTTVAAVPSNGTHVVRRGETISTIARRYGVGESALVSANRLRSRNHIVVGQKLRVPSRGGTVVLASAKGTPRPAPPRAKPTPPPSSSNGGNGGASGAGPSDYSVHSDDRITVQADETLGHYAEWLGVSASRLRSMNGFKSTTPVAIGRPIRLDFSRVTPAIFEQRRLAHHRTLQEEFFDNYAVSGTETHVLSRGDTLWYLAHRKFRVPVWLLRQYNPSLDFASLQPGMRMIVPQVEPRAG